MTPYGSYYLGSYQYSMESMLSLLLVILCAIAAAIASAKVSSTYKKYDRVPSSRRITAEQAARMVLQRAGIMDVQVQHIQGNLTDNYNPKTKVLSLSDSTYGHSSIAAIGVACHEAGHAIQHDQGYLPIKIRNSLIPVCNFGTYAGIPLAIIGAALGRESIVVFGLLLYSAIAIFQLVTLPVELNASHRAMEQMQESGLLTGEELKGARKVLTAAAMTYVAAVASVLANLLRYTVLLLGRSRRDD